MSLRPESRPFFDTAVSASLFALMTISAVASGCGIFFNFPHRGPVDFTLALIASLAATASVQLLMVFAIQRVKMSGFFARIGWLVVTAAMLGLSIGFEYSSLHSQLSGPKIAERMARENTEQVLAALRTFDAEFGSMSESLATLSEYSERKAREEREQGGTCGTYSKPEPGPRSRLRDRDEDLFGALSAECESRALRLDEQVGNLASALEAYDPESHAALRRDLLEALASVRDLGRGAFLPGLRQQLEARIELGHGRITDPNGTTFSCPDATIEAQGSIVAGSVGRLLGIGGDLPAVIDLDPNDQGARFSYAQDRLSDLMTAMIAGAPSLPSVDELTEARVRALSGHQDDPTAFTSDDLWPLALACMIDGLICLMAFVNGPGGRGSQGLVHGPIDWLAHIEDALRARIPGISLDQLVRQNRLCFGGRDYVAVAEPPREQEKDLSLLLDLYVANDEARVVGENVPAGKLERLGYRAPPGDGDPPRRYRLYQLQKKLIERNLNAIVKLTWRARDSGAPEPEHPSTDNG